MLPWAGRKGEAMTILVAVKTATDLVIAADSKITVNGIGGIDAQGNINWIPQTYDHGTKIGFSKSNLFVGAAAGQVAFGSDLVIDIITQFKSTRFSTRSTQETQLKKLLDQIKTLRSNFYQTFLDDPLQWPITTLLLFSSDPEGRGVRSWHVNYFGDAYDMNEILTHTWVWLDGTYDRAFTLLYGFGLGYQAAVTTTIASKYGLDEADVRSTISTAAHLMPLTQINVQAMPIQDAIDSAVFIASTEVEIERFLPGTPACGGSIDVAVVHGLPKHTTTWFPGKEVRHPRR
jgi:hypothetical protein